MIFLWFQHFVGGNGPTDQYPDPIQADGTGTKPARKKVIRGTPKKTQGRRKRLNFEDTIDNTSTSNSVLLVESETGTSMQTEEKWISPMDMLAVSAELHRLQSELDLTNNHIKQLEAIITTLKQENKQLS